MSPPLFTPIPEDKRVAICTLCMTESPRASHRSSFHGRHFWCDSCLKRLRDELIGLALPLILLFCVFVAPLQAQTSITLQPGASITIKAAPPVKPETVWVVSPPSPDTQPTPPKPDTTPTPPPVTAGAASFETGWDGFGNWNGCGAGYTPTGVVRQQVSDAPDGKYVVQRSWTKSQAESSGRMESCFANTGRVGMRFSFKLTAPINSIMKFVRVMGNHGGFFIENGSNIISWGWDDEDQSIATGIGLTQAKVIDGKYHTLEADYQRNGDPSGFPVVRFWFDGTPQCLPDGTTGVRYAGAGNKSYWRGCALYAGERAFSGTFSELSWLSTLNASPGTDGTVSLDLIAVSPTGRP